MTTSTLSPRHTLLIFLALWLFTSLFVGWVPTRHLTADAANNLLYVTNDDHYELWHGQHLLALWPGYAAAQLTGSAYSGIRLAHALLAGATVALLYLALQRLVAAWRIALPVALAIVCSYGFWHYASDPDIYMTGYAAVALLLLVLVYTLPQPTPGRVLLLGLAASLAILCHQMNIEIAGIIGLALVWLALRSSGLRIGWWHVLLYALASLLPTALFYLAGWQDVSAWLVRQGETAPGFLDWALRYFNVASSGEATWGVTLHFSTLPVAGYTLIQSWILPPRTLDITSVFTIGLLGVGSVVVAVSAVALARRFSPVERMMAVICFIGLLANAVSGWWWQVGNIKFTLFMQLYLLVMVAIVARAASAAAARRVTQAGLAALGIGLLLNLLLYTLPHETQGGVFRLLELYGDQYDVKFYIEDRIQDQVIEYVSDRSARLLPAESCTNLPDYGASPYGHIWLLSAERAATCALDGATLVDSYLSDRARTIWQVWDVTAITTPANSR